MIYHDDFPKPQEPYVSPQDSQRPVITCPHCGNSITLVLPIDLRIASDVLQAFANLHEYCRKQKVFEKAS